MSIESELKRLLTNQTRKTSKPHQIPGLGGASSEIDEEWEQMGWFRKTLDVLGRPNYASAAAAKALIQGRNPFSAALRGLKGEQRTTYSEVLGLAGMDKGLARAVLGFAGDVLLDPTTYLTFGAGGGAKVAIKGAQKVLTKGGAALKVAKIAEKEAKWAKLLPELAEKAPARYARVVKAAGLGGEFAEKPTVQFLAKRAAEESAKSSLVRAAKQGQKVFSEPALRFAGMPIVPGKVLAKPFVAAGKAYQAAEKIPHIGELLRASREAGITLKEAARTVFKRTTKHPVVDWFLKLSADTLNFDTNRFVHRIVEPMVKHMDALRALGPEEYAKGEKQIRQYLEGVLETVSKEVPNDQAIAKITSGLDQLQARLNDIRTVREQSFIGATQGVLERAKIATKEASERTKVAAQAHEAQYGQFLKDLRRLGMADGGMAGEVKLHVPRSMRNPKSRYTPDYWTDWLVRSGELPAGSTEADLWAYLERALKKPGRVSPQDVLEKIGVPAGAEKRVLDEAALAVREKRAVEAMARGREKLATLPKVAIETVERVRKAIENPHARAVALLQRRFYRELMKRENRVLAFPAQPMEFYFPHYIRNEIRDALTKLVPSEMRKLARPEMSGRVSEALSRTVTKTVDEVTVSDLIRSGSLDPAKVDELLKKNGIAATFADKLVFETDPVKVFMKRGMAHIKAVNASEFARSVMNDTSINKARISLTSPGAADTITDMLKQHPDHKAFVASKDFIRMFKTPDEIAAMRKGADQGLAASFLQELPDTMLNRALKQAKSSGGAEVYILPQEVAQHLSRAYTIQFDTEEMRNFVHLWDRMTALWKAFATTFRPAFHVRNEGANLWQMLLAGVRSPEPLTKAMFAMSNPKLVGNVGTWTAEEAVQLAERLGVLHTGFVHAEIEDFIAGIAQRSKNPLSPRGPWARTGMKIGSAFEDHAKLAVFFDQLMKGSDPIAAAMQAKKYLFDYGDLSSIEKAFFRRVVPFYCADETTEILTARGWLTLDEVTDSDQAFCLDPSSNVATWEKIKSVNVFSVNNEPLVRMTNTRMDALTTPNHKWIAVNSGMKGGHWTLRIDPPRFHWMVTDEIRARKKCVLQVGGGEYEAPAKPIYSDEFVELVGWVVTEGWYPSVGNSVQLAQSNEHNPGHVERIRAIAEFYRKGGATVSEYMKDNGWGPICTFYFGKGIGSEIRRVAPKKQLTPEFLVKLTKGQLDLLFCTLMKGDGHVTKKGHRVWAQKDQGRIDAFQMLCSMRGERTHSRPGEGSGCSQIAVYRSPNLYANKLDYSNVLHTGRVWCPTTKHGTWMARRNGVTYWTGNTFTRKNVPLSIETLLTKPGYPLALTKAQKAGEENVDNAIGKKYVAEFIRNGLGIPVWTDAAGKTYFFLMRNWIPTADLAQMDFQNYASMLHPAPKAVIEFWTNKSVFSGRKIERYPGAKEKFLGIPMRGHVANVLRNAVIASELDRMFFKEEMGSIRSPAGALGFRTYAQDKVIQMRSYVYNLQEQMGELKNIIRLSEQRYGPDSEITQEAKDRLEATLLKRDKAKEDLLKIDPDALKTRRPAAQTGTPSVPVPVTMPSRPGKIDLDRLLREGQK